MTTNNAEKTTSEQTKSRKGFWTCCHFNDSLITTPTNQMALLFARLPDTKEP
ncbi:MAG: hypothetical protein ACI89J_001119 [Hyphomicrobiaceae bacterium]|jgi:hypothetical protein